VPDKERCKLPEWVSGYGKVDGDDHQTKGHVFGGSEVRMMYDCIVHTTEKEREREREREREEACFGRLSMVIYIKHLAQDWVVGRELVVVIWVDRASQ
jgi:hypothetical protein